MSWEHVRQLIGQELKTVDRGKPFIVDAVGERSLTVIPSGTSPQAVMREALELAMGKYAKNPNLTRKEIQGDLPRHRITSYLLAICRELAKHGFI